MSVIEDFTAWYQNLPTWGKVGIPVAGAAGVAYIVLHNRNSTGLTATNTLPANGSGSSAGGGGGGSNPAPVINPFPAPTGGGTPGPGAGGTPINYLGPPTPAPTTTSPGTTLNPNGGPTLVGGYASNPIPPTPAQIAAISNPYHASSAAVASAAALSSQPSTTPAWGTPISLTAPSGDTYLLAEQYYYALQNPSAAAGTPFANVNAPSGSYINGTQESVGQFQLGQLVGQIQGQGAAYWGGYPAIPTNVLSAGGVATGVATTSQMNTGLANSTYIPLSTQTANGTTTSSQPGVTINSAAQQQLASYIATYQAIPVSQQTAKQQAALATDLATYQRQYGSYPS